MGGDGQGHGGSMPEHSEPRLHDLVVLTLLKIQAATDFNTFETQQR